MMCLQRDGTIQMSLCNTISSQVYTQLQIANAAFSHGSLTNDHMLCYHCLLLPIFTNWMITITYSVMQDFRWVQVNPMKIKVEAQMALSLIVQCEVVPPSMGMDGSKEQTLGKTTNKLLKDELHCSCLKTTERGINNLQTDSRYNMHPTGMPRCLWDDCLEKDADICFHSANSIYHNSMKLRKLFWNSTDIHHTPA